MISRPWWKNSTGLTLIEILIVVIIIAILAALILPKMLGQTERARLAEVYQMIGALNRAQQNRMDLTGENPLAFTCTNPPATCASGSATRLATLRQLGLNDFPQRDFKYSCVGTTLASAYCQAYRGTDPAFPTTNPRILKYYANTTTPAYVNVLYCGNGYVREATGTSGYNTTPSGRCLVNPSHANWQ